MFPPNVDKVPEDNGPELLYPDFVRDPVREIQHTQGVPRSKHIDGVAGSAVDVILDEHRAVGGVVEVGRADDRLLQAMKLADIHLSRK